MESGEKMLTFLNRVKQLADSLKSMNVNIDDKEMAMAVLSGLPSSYESLIVALDALGNDDRQFTFDFVKSRLIQEEQRCIEREKSDSVKQESSALFGMRSGGQPSKNGREKNRYKCTTCGRDVLKM